MKRKQGGAGYQFQYIRKKNILVIRKGVFKNTFPYMAPTSCSFLFSFLSILFFPSYRT